MSCSRPLEKNVVCLGFLLSCLSYSWDINPLWERKVICINQTSARDTFFQSFNINNLNKDICLLRDLRVLLLLSVISFLVDQTNEYASIIRLSTCNYKWFKWFHTAQHLRVKDLCHRFNHNNPPCPIEQCIDCESHLCDTIKLSSSCNTWYEMI